jgi:hypothetical protein
MQYSTTPHTGEAVARRACGGPAGMGWLQNNPSATEEDVWKNVHTAPLGGDYPSGHINVLGGTKPGSVSADYVFGRMMKLNFDYGPDSVTLDDGRTPRQDYQSWCVTYKSYPDVFAAAMKSLEPTPV